MLLGYLPEKASTFAPEIDGAFNFILYVCIFFFVAVIGLKIFFIFKYKRRSEDEVTPRITHNLLLEVVWTVIPLIIVMFMFYVGYKTFFTMMTPPQGKFTDIYVTGQKWRWKFQYETGLEVISSPTQREDVKDYPLLTVPVDTPIRLILTSKDVLHSFAVPAFRIKRDVIQNQRRETWFQATKEGTYLYTCNEMCGQDHSQMIGYVKVVSKEAFKTYLADNKPSVDPLTVGKKIFTQQCSSCHSNEAPSEKNFAMQGPTWFGLYTGTGDRTRPVAGKGDVKVDFDYIAKAIREPKEELAIVEYGPKKGQTYPPAMAPFANFSDDQIKAIITYMKTLNK
mgnify:CR=1 FL=1